MDAGERQQLQHFKEAGRALLYALTSCPAEKIRPSNEFLPVLEFCNGYTHPTAAKYPPNAVYFEFQGERWRLLRGHKAWRKA